MGFPISTVANIISAYSATSGAGQGTYGYTNTMQTYQLFAGNNYLSGLNDSVDQSVIESKLIDPTLKSGFASGADSIFNKFTVFSYSGLFAGFQYEEGGHFIGYYNKNIHDVDSSAKIDKASASQKAATLYSLQSDLAKTKGDPKLTAAEKSARISQINQTISNVSGKNSRVGESFDKNVLGIRSNPTATNLIAWGSDVSGTTTQGFSPYSYTDFAFCKNYGRIPNNRLITLRRYPFPIGDSVRIGTDRKKSALPTAQAVTWFGGDTENSLNSIPFFSWDMPWSELKIEDYQSVEGNEILAKDVFDVLSGITGKDSTSKLASLLYTAGSGDNDKLSQLTGVDKKIQDFQRSLYTTGPYWNRIYGPVNVVNATSHRTRGVQTANWKNSFKIVFHYSFRSFNGLSPKIVALDLISNFLNLTYNDAQFLGQLYRYFPKTGLKFDDTSTEALGKLITNWGSSFNGDNSDELHTILKQAMEAFSQSTANFISDPAKAATDFAKKAIQTKTADLLSKAMPAFLSIKSALSDRPVGEWHLTVGNPMNPIFVSGDLIVTDTQMKFDEELGPDDFPTGVKFTVTLQQGKPRDKTAIERMLNLGDTKLTTGTIKSSTADDTFGTNNNEVYNKEVASKSSTAEIDLINSSTATSKFGKYRDRFRKGYNLEAPGSQAKSSSTIDDSLLLFYYTRRYEHN